MSGEARIAALTAERSVLSQALLNPEIVGWLDVRPEHFFDVRNQVLWRAMHALRDRGVGLDPVTLEAELGANGKLEAIGGLAYVADVALEQAQADNVEFYAGILHQRLVTRRLMLACSSAIGRAKSGEAHGEELLDSLMAELGAIDRVAANERTSMADAASVFFRDLVRAMEARERGESVVAGLPTGIAPLDAELGGLPIGTVTALGGRQGEGKSSLALNIADNATDANERDVAIVYTTEDPRERWIERGAARRSGVDVTAIYQRDLTRQEFSLVTSAAESMRRKTNLHIVHAHGWGVREIARDAVARARGKRLVLVVVDYVQKLRAPQRGLKQQDAIEENSKALGDLAGKSGAAVLVLSQLLKEVEKEARRPKLGDLRYGEGLANECKLALLIHDPRDQNDRDGLDIVVPKRNQGRRNVDVRVQYDRAHCVIR